MKRVINNTMKDNKNKSKNIILVNTQTFDKIKIKDKTNNKIILDKRG